ncbi:MAG: chemotaxis protein CheC [Clostridia bacterium]
MDDLSQKQIDILREIGTIGSGNAATSLSKLINKEVVMNVPKVNILKFDKVNEILGDPEAPLIGILFTLNVDLKGCIMITLKLDAARSLVEMLFNKKVSKDHKLTEDELSALKEIGNILAGSYLSAISYLTKFEIIHSVPDIAIDMAGSILSVPAIQFGKIGDSTIYIETEFYEGKKKVVGDFFLIPDIDSFDKLFKTLEVMI